MKTRLAALTLVLAAAGLFACTMARAAIVHVNVDDSDTAPIEANEATTYVFTNLRTGDRPVSSNSSSDLANGITPVIISGIQHPASGAISILTDGSGGLTAGGTTDKFFYVNSSSAHMFRISLPSVSDIGQINTYSWHVTADTDSRSHQKYNLWASDGTAGGFALNDPMSPGWSQLATSSQTDTRAVVGNTGGQVGVSVNPDSGPFLGNFRHFIFEVFNGTNPSDSTHHTFFSEIDISSEPPPQYNFVKYAAGDPNPVVSADDLLHGRPVTLSGGATHTASDAATTANDGSFDSGRFFFADGSDAFDPATLHYELEQASNIEDIRIYSFQAVNFARNPFLAEVTFLDKWGGQIGETLEMRSGYGGTPADLDGSLGSGVPHQPDSGGSNYGLDPDDNFGLGPGYVTRMFSVGGENLAEKVWAIDFTFFPVRTGNDDVHYRLPNATGYPMIREIDVFGVQVPEPASGVLLAAGFAGLLPLARRRRPRARQV